MHVDAPVADLVVDEPLLEQGGLLKAGEPEEEKDDDNQEVSQESNLRTALPLTQLSDLR